jgi:peptidoglycan/xylan/chitin deacetylase (PgdA/CDA1 family)
MSRIAVLGYHKIGTRSDGRDSWFYIPARSFERHLRVIEDGGWRVLDVRRFLAGLADPESLPARSVLLTFDDGYRSMRDDALRLLRDRGWPAVLFVPTGFIGGSNDFDAGVEPQEPICCWEDLFELEQHGVSIQSHGVGHRAFSTLAEEAIEQEIVDSKRVLEGRMNRPVELFSYPYGDAGMARAVSATALRRAGYKAAFGFQGAPMTIPIADEYLIERVAVGPDTDLAGALGDA